MPILNILFRGKIFHKSFFASLAVFFSRFSFRIFRQPSLSQPSHFFEKLNFNQVKNRAESKFDNSIKVDSGIRVTNSIEVVGEYENTNKKNIDF